MLQIESQRLLDKFGQTEQIQAIAFHILFQSGPLLHSFITISKKHILLLGQVSLQKQIDKSRHIQVMETFMFEIVLC